ncbi:TniB family NTP-binding protein [Pseudomonas sp. BE134]|uniref:TniB family NTP-binding protein n=1 Tax=Pseudomonas sp. BE134 TaxID=2817843 RepID=UPI00285BA6AE|nr:TniB family NTP-binding protein [Pseudomonas sp. BE134]MDR6924254.1 hypothetical protein [Pseudomonas sp. BE134]
MDMQEEFSHVLEARRALVSESVIKRYQAIYEDVWVNYPAAAYILAVIDQFLQIPIGIQAPCILVHSSPGMGKTALFEKIDKTYGIASGAKSCVVSLSLQDKETDNHRKFVESTVAALTSIGNLRLDSNEDVLLQAIRMNRIRALVIDELNDMLLCRPADIRKNLKWLKQLSAWPYGLVLICIGTGDCKNVVQSDPQIQRRFDNFELKKWVDKAELRSFLNSFQGTLPLRFKSELHTLPVATYLINETGGVLDSIVKRVRRAAIWAIKEGHEKVDLEMLKLAKNIPILDGLHCE